ncbi:hypothetical protein [Sulfurimonas sp. RIFOXYB12_FULL_35_9]|jgi:hypothetical protein|uniref:hypothetical protein n=1 Tax=Sulfurimonas sp. RIFOXYB12_FULL_35_9 TaxID=1802256 RepID=UPI0008B74B21|nr:hypothetical protein [Sulfurimonas sp. RIFOXYB12_FULL_35_9]MDX9756186.1 hypothetical protein [Sulfurimonas sp.]OHE04663.1 MAG: hypothetical protein A2345_12275 [Sulfurimonas sp. RIFOXYB12_FULL_35_9]
MYKQALQKAQGAENKKVGFNLQIPNLLKAEFEHQCKKDDVTVTSMIISLMEVSLVESYLSSVPKVQELLSDLKYILNSEDIFLPNPISDSNPMFSKTVSEDDFEKLMKIYLELSLAINEFKETNHVYIGMDFSYKFDALNLMDSATACIRRIARNMDKKDEFNAVQGKYNDIVLEKFNLNMKDEK